MTAVSARTRVRPHEGWYAPPAVAAPPTSASRTPRRAALPAPVAQAFAERLDRLFRAAGDPSLEDTARAIHDGGGPTISASYLWLLRTGRRPTRRWRT